MQYDASNQIDSIPYMQFSSKLTKLFVNMDKACPISFSLSIVPHLFSEYSVRSQIVFSK